MQKLDFRTKTNRRPTSVLEWLFQSRLRSCPAWVAGPAADDDLVSLGAGEGPGGVLSQLRGLLRLIRTTAKPLGLTLDAQLLVRWDTPNLIHHHRKLCASVRAALGSIRLRKLLRLRSHIIINFDEFWMAVDQLPS